MEIIAVKSGWELVANTPEEAEVLEMKSNLIIEITKLIRKKRWADNYAAKKCGITQKRLNDLLDGSISKFSLEDLVNIFTNLGLKLNFSYSS